MDRRAHHRAGVLIALIVAFAPAVAGAQDAERARELFQQGVQRMQEERFQEAAEAFRASYDASPRVATMCNLALAYDRWGAYPEVAAEAYERCAREDTSGRFQEHAQQRAEELRAQLASEPAPEPPPGSEAPPDLPPDPFVAGTPPDPGAGPGPTPGDPLGPSQPPEGTPPSEPPSGNGLLIGGIVSGVVAAGALVGAALLAGSAAGDEEDLHRMYPDTDGDGIYQIPRNSEGEEILDSAETKATWSVALYIVGGAAAALAATLVVLDLTAPTPESQAQLGFAATPDGALVTARTSF